jgi:hypothetical protein
MRKKFFALILSLVFIFSFKSSVSAALSCKTGADCSNAEICQGGFCVPLSAAGNGGGSDTVFCQGDKGIQSAIGCIPVLADANGTAFMGFVLKWAVGAGSGIAFLLILYGGFIVMTSQGNPERLKAGQELLTSAISGLLLIIFSIFVLKVIGVDILGLGAFGFGK